MVVMTRALHIETLDGHSSTNILLEANVTSEDSYFSTSAFYGIRSKNTPFETYPSLIG